MTAEAATAYEAAGMIEGALEVLYKAMRAVGKAVEVVEIGHDLVAVANQVPSGVRRTPS